MDAPDLISPQAVLGPDVTATVAALTSPETDSNDVIESERLEDLDLEATLNATQGSLTSSMPRSAPGSQSRSGTDHVSDGEDADQISTAGYLDEGQALSQSLDSDRISMHDAASISSSRAESIHSAHAHSLPLRTTPPLAQSSPPTPRNSSLPAAIAASAFAPDSTGVASASPLRTASETTSPLSVRGLFLS